MTRLVPLQDPKELSARSAELEQASPLEILRFSLATWPGLAISSAFGVEDCAIIDLCASLVPGPSLHVFSIDTDFLFPETHALKARIEERYGVTVKVWKGSVTKEEQDAAHGERLYERNPDLCCAIRKIEPIGRALESVDAWVTGMRRDQGPSRAGIQILERYDHKDGSPLIKVNPLARWTHKDTWAHVMKHEVPYNPLFDQGYKSIGCWPCSRPVAAGADERAGRWGGQKAECGIHTFMIRKDPSGPPSS